MTTQFKTPSSILVRHYHPTSEEEPTATFLSSFVVFDAQTKGVTYSVSVDEHKYVEDERVEGALFNGTTLFGRIQDECKITERISKLVIQPESSSLLEKLLHANFVQMAAFNSDTFVPTSTQFSLSEPVKKAIYELVHGVAQEDYDNAVKDLCEKPVMVLATSLHSPVTVHLKDVFNAKYSKEKNTYLFDVEGVKFEIALQKLINL